MTTEILWMIIVSSVTATILVAKGVKSWNKQPAYIKRSPEEEMSRQKVAYRRDAIIIFLMLYALMLITYLSISVTLQN